MQTGVLDDAETLNEFAKLRRGPCSVCPSDVSVFPLNMCGNSNCHHFFFSECFQAWLREKMRKCFFKLSFCPIVWPHIIVLIEYNRIFSTKLVSSQPFSFVGQKGSLLQLCTFGRIPRWGIFVDAEGHRFLGQFSYPFLHLILSCLILS